MSETWVNDDGLVVISGKRDVEKVIPTHAALNAGGLQELILHFDFASAASIGADSDRGDVPFIPDGALILDAVLQIETTFTGATTGLLIGTEDSAGSVIDADGIGPAATFVNASLVAGGTIVADGAQIGTALAVNGYLTVAPDASTLTAGVGTLKVRYVL